MMILSFAGKEDVCDVWNKPDFDAESLVKMGDAAGLPPGFQPMCAAPCGDGSYYLYGHISALDKSWRLYRARTVDGFVFTNAEQVFSGGPETPGRKKWLGFAAMCRRGSDGKMFFYKWGRAASGGFVMWVYESEGGREWICSTADEERLLQEHDSNIVIWDEAGGEFINYQITYSDTGKPFPDNPGYKRRVMAIRTSSDGVSWSDELDPETRKPVDADHRALIQPDGDDSEDLEFYRFFVFRHNGRYIGMQLNYAASPGFGNTHFRKERYRRPEKDAGHAPMLGGEWWISDDGFRWRRSFRDVFACGEADGIIRHEPMCIGHDLLWIDSNEVYGLPRVRMFCIRSLANAAFTTKSFEAPDSYMALDAEFGYDRSPRRGMQGQGYIMVEVLGDNGETVEGFEADKCLIHDLDIPSRRMEWEQYGGALLTWQGRPLSDLKGRNVRLRFHFRDARIYGLKWE